MRSSSERDTAAGLGLFVALSFLGSWFVAAALRVFELNVAPGPLGTRLFATSLLYAATMGWQPAVATWVVRRFVDREVGIDLGLRPASRVFSIGGGLAALGLVAAATALTYLAVALGWLPATPLDGNVEAELAGQTPSLLGVALLTVLFLATLSLVWIQTFAEEVGWRGYFLPRLQARCGPRRGLVLHGIVWGFWYAPVLFFATYGQLPSSDSVARSLAFVVSCVLLGILFGWLRLASKSLAPVVIANSTLTLAAGLPYVLHGLDAGPRATIYLPLGWIVLGVAVVVLWRLGPAVLRSSEDHAPLRRTPTHLN